MCFVNILPVYFFNFPGWGFLLVTVLISVFKHYQTKILLILYFLKIPCIKLEKCVLDFIILKNVCF